jgi:hypothetical protein
VECFAAGTTRQVFDPGSTFSGDLGLDKEPDFPCTQTIKYHQRESLASFASAPKQNSPIGGLLELASHLLLGIHRRNILLRRPSDVTALLRQRFFTRVTVTVRASDVSALQYILMRHFCCDVSAT